MARDHVRSVRSSGIRVPGLFDEEHDFLVGQEKGSGLIVDEEPHPVNVVR
jgi:hypothetical protein